MAAYSPPAYAGRHPSNTSDVWLLRLTAEGHPDPSFGSGGETRADVVPASDYAEGLAIQPDGRAVISGVAFEGSDKLLVGRFTGPEPVKVSPIPTKARCAGRNATIVGTAGADKLKGTKKADVIAGLGGNDRINALAGNDIVCGGTGKDTINGGGKDKPCWRRAPTPAWRSREGQAAWRQRKGQAARRARPRRLQRRRRQGRHSHGCETRKKLP